MRRQLLTLVWCAGFAACTTPAAPPTPAAGETASLFEGARLIADAAQAPIEFSAFYEVQARNLAAAGMTPAQVLTAATRTSAAVLTLDQLGTIAPGKSADVVVLYANPLDDIANTRRISREYLRGQAIDRAALKAQWTSPAATSSE